MNPPKFWYILPACWINACKLDVVNSGMLGKRNIHRPAPAQNFSLPKKMGPQRKDFGGRYGFLVFMGFLYLPPAWKVLLLGQKSSFGGGRVRFFLLWDGGVSPKSAAILMRCNAVVPSPCCQGSLLLRRDVKGNNQEAKSFQTRFAVNLLHFFHWVCSEKATTKHKISMLASRRRNGNIAVRRGIV